MSAYVVNPHCIAALARYAIDHDAMIYDLRDQVGNTRSIAACQAVAKLLMEENIRSVCYRYGDDTPANYRETLRDTLHYAKLAMQYPGRYSELKPVDILSMCGGLEYQSCETPNWRETRAHQQIQWIIDAAHRALPGWDDAQRDYTGGPNVKDQSVMNISALLG